MADTSAKIEEQSTEQITPSVPWVGLARLPASSRRASARRASRLRQAIIVGAGQTGQALARLLEGNTQCGYSVVGFLDENHHEDPQLLGEIQDLPKIASSRRIDTIFVTPETTLERMRWLARQGAERGFGVQLVSDSADGCVGHCLLHRLGPFPVLPLHHVPIARWQLLLKRAIDVVVSAVALVLLLPLVPFVALLIKLDSPGSVFHRSWRVSKAGKLFVCHKLRTMVSNAESMLEDLWPLNEREGLIFKLSNDPRITRLGKFLRKYSIDELPQLWSVFAGHMSLVGPRPPLASEYMNYKAEHMGRLAVTPGITGLWQVKARTDPSLDSYLSLDLEYVQKWSVALDLKILLETIPTVLKGTGQ